MRVGDHVHLRRAPTGAVGVVLSVNDYRAIVEWPDRSTSTWHVDLLRAVAPPPVSIAAVVATEAVNVRMEEIVDEVTDVIASIVRMVCMGERDLYRDLLERVAQRLGDV